MTKHIKVSLLVMSLILAVVLISTVGTSLAIWTSSGGIGEGSQTQSPTAIAVDDYVWAKYFQYSVETVNETDRLAFTSFYFTVGSTSKGINLGDVVFPAKIDNKNAYRITNTVFMDTTMKSLPVTVYIPNTVCQIDAFAFVNMPNLVAVIFYGDNGMGACHIDNNAFVGCPNLTTVDFGLRTIEYETAQASSFVGCNDSLTTTHA